MNDDVLIRVSWPGDPEDEIRFARLSEILRELQGLRDERDALRARTRSDRDTIERLHHKVSKERKGLLEWKRRADDAEAAEEQFERLRAAVQQAHIQQGHSSSEHSVILSHNAWERVLAAAGDVGKEAT